MKFAVHVLSLNFKLSRKAKWEEFSSALTLQHLPFSVYLKSWVILDSVLACFHLFHQGGFFLKFREFLWALNKSSFSSYYYGWVESVGYGDDLIRITILPPLSIPITKQLLNGFAVKLSENIPQMADGLMAHWKMAWLTCIFGGPISVIIFSCIVFFKGVFQKYQLISITYANISVMGQYWL